MAKSCDEVQAVTSSAALQLHQLVAGLADGVFRNASVWGLGSRLHGMMLREPLTPKP